MHQLEEEQRQQYFQMLDRVLGIEESHGLAFKDEIKMQRYQKVFLINQRNVSIELMKEFFQKEGQKTE